MTRKCGKIILSANSTCGTVIPSVLSIGLNFTAPVTPPSISGPAKVCPGDIAVYSIANVARASAYNWTAPTGMNIVNGQGTNVVTMTITNAFAGGAISLSASNACGASPTRTKTINFYVPNTPAAISGIKTGLCGVTGAMFSTAGTSNATGYQWTVPTGVTLVSGQGTNTIFVNISSGFASGILKVTGTNGCGAGSTRSLSIYGVSGQPGTINGPTNVCPSQVNVTYEISTVSGATSYAWNVPFGASIVSGQGTKTIIVNFGPTAVNNQVVSVGATNACGQSGWRLLSGISINSSHCGTRIENVSSTISQVVLYPNPARENVNIQFNSTIKSDYQITLVDHAGRMIASEMGVAMEGNNMKSINIETLSSGIYSIVIRVGNDVQQSRLLVE